MTRNALITCDRCGHDNDAGTMNCVHCGTPLNGPFYMDKQRLARVHMLATQKGMIAGNDKEYYKLRLQRFGIDSSKQIKDRALYLRVIRDFESLPDAA